MNLGFSSLASGSSGNCYLVMSDKTSILVDVGTSKKNIAEELALVHRDLKKVDGVLLTHEHVDHVKSLSGVFHDAKESVCYATAGTIEAMGNKAGCVEGRLTTIKKGDSFKVGDIEVDCFGVSHDAREPVAYCFRRQGKKIAILTDTGCITEDILAAIGGADVLVIEANHEVNILLYGRYPYNVKHRILSDRGHLSNEAAGQCIAEFLRGLEGRKIPKVMLAHLSKENNTPQQALLTVRNVLEENGFYIDKDLTVEITMRDTMTDVIAV